ncbi:hypothetical protein A3Q56_07099 [Intoshia linei]|uniref:Very-long-chain (3R)-3-hydroxyacyl-CoA dehydratase n=1 Tax=Intoshia linei TaxID=1819745 RepID=A0A177AUL1_9BILA|nr:hypothetical protein A3Q56_07099 [Intoshia linei]
MDDETYITGNDYAKFSSQGYSGTNNLSLYSTNVPQFRPIENAHSIIKREIFKNKFNPKNADELEEKIHSVLKNRDTLLKCITLGIYLYTLIFQSLSEVPINTFKFLAFFQTLAVMEIFHILFGLIKSSVFRTIPQYSSRVFILWFCGYIHMSTQSPSNTCVYTMAWSLSEIIRYSHYAGKLSNNEFKFIGVLRYSAFIVLYPVGVASELVASWLAMQKVRSKMLLSYNYDIQYAIYFQIIVWIISLHILYQYLLGERKKYYFSCSFERSVCGLINTHYNQSWMGILQPYKNEPHKAYHGKWFLASNKPAILESENFNFDNMICVDFYMYNKSPESLLSIYRNNSKIERLFDVKGSLYKKWTRVQLQIHIKKFDSVNCLNLIIYS